MNNNSHHNNGNDEDDGEAAIASAPSTKIRLHLRGSNLPRSIVTGQQPDTQCRISLQPSDINSGLTTEVVCKSSNPKYTTYIPLEYEYGTELLIYVHVYASRNNFASGKNSTSELKLLGSVFYDVADILGNQYQTKARSLRKGGTIYAHIEQDFTVDNPNNTSIPRPIGDSSDNNNSKSRIFSLRLRASSLIFTSSVLQNKFVSPTILKGKPDTYFELSRPAYTTTEEGTVRKSASSTWIVVYRSPPVLESITPLYDEAMIDLNSLHFATKNSASSNDWNSYPILISIYKVKKKKCKELGSFETTIQALIESGQSEEEEEAGDSSFLLQPKSSKGVQSNETTGKVTVVSAFIQRLDEVRQRPQRILPRQYLSSGSTIGFNNLSLTDETVQSATPTPSKFSDYIDAGLDIDLCVAIDFTSSNGNPRTPGTLHYSRDGMSNDYADTVESIGSEVENYSKNTDFTVWGFGAKFDGQVRHIFQCGQSPTVNGSQGLVDAYRSVFESDLTMSGPTIMKSVLNAAAARAKKVHMDPSKQLKYTVLLILTDGVVNDLESSREFLSKLRHLPLSVVVVGIGRTDFTQMIQWNEQPSQFRGKFTFVEFRPLQFDLEALSGKALERVPQEVVDYFNSV